MRPPGEIFVMLLIYAGALTQSLLGLYSITGVI